MANMGGDLVDSVQDIADDVPAIGDVPAMGDVPAIGDAVNGVLPMSGEVNGVPAIGDVVDGVLTILPGTTKIKAQAYEDQHDITTVIFPDSLVVIGDEAFYGCTGLTRIDCSHTKLTTIGRRAFSYCIRLDEATFPDTLARLGEHVFLDTALKGTVTRLQPCATMLLAWTPCPYLSINSTMRYDAFGLVPLSFN